MAETIHGEASRKIVVEVAVHHREDRETEQIRLQNMLEKLRMKGVMIQGGMYKCILE